MNFIYGNWVVQRSSLAHISTAKTCRDTCRLRSKWKISFTKKAFIRQPFNSNLMFVIKKYSDGHWSFVPPLQCSVGCIDRNKSPKHGMHSRVPERLQCKYVSDTVVKFILKLFTLPIDNLDVVEKQYNMEYDPSYKSKLACWDQARFITRYLRMHLFDLQMSHWRPVYTHTRGYSSQYSLQWFLLKIFINQWN